MSDTIEFPIGVELPLRGGGVAVLYEFFDGTWFGRLKFFAEDPWTANDWLADGREDGGTVESDYDILPPKRKAWVVWYPDTDNAKASFRKPSEIATTAEYASLRAKELGGTYQEITEP